MGKGIYKRGYLPHWDFAGSLQAITFRLADSVPNLVISEWRRELAEISDEVARERDLHCRIARYEDAGAGESFLIRPDCAAIVQDKLIKGHPAQYRLIDWCVMPNHVHVLCKLEGSASLSEVVRSWKGASAMEINRLLQRSGPLWQREYFDRLVRDTDHLHECRAYIRNNPVKAKLCEKPADWAFSSAGIRWSPDGALASAGESNSPEDTHAG
ncbi:MAG: hypothetical protein RLZZ522_939 [Verrucomicrobiota bacterium]